MGAWGVGAFENDSALDFLRDLREQGGPAIKALFEEIDSEESQEYLDSDVGSPMTAFADALCRACGFKGPPSPDDAIADETIQERAAEILAFPDVFVQTKRALDRVLSDNSELPGLWEGDEAWVSLMDDLKNRLEAAHAAADTKGRPS